MITPLTHEQQELFTTACSYERIFGSKALCALRAYGLESTRARFYLCMRGSIPTAALYLEGGVLAVSAYDASETESIAALVRQERVTEVDSRLEHCEALQALLGGTIDQSYYMKYCGGELERGDTVLVPGKLPDVFDVLQRSHEYYRAHLRYDAWSERTRHMLECGLMELYQLERGGVAVGTGSIASEDDECGVVGAVAVVPELRHNGLGLAISRFLTRRILQKGKTPRLISGYDEVARLYAKLGYEPYGRWGELYLT